VFLRRHRRAGLGDRGNDRFDIERLDRRDIDHFGGDALFCQDLRGPQGLVDHQPAGKNADVIAAAEDLGPPELELVIIIEDQGEGSPGEPDIDRVRVMILQGMDGLT
jgi:hypothetical protein